MMFSAPDLTLDARTEEDGPVYTRGLYKGIPIAKAAVLEGEMRCLVLLDPHNRPEQRRFQNLFCISCNGETIWTAPLPETHDAYAYFRLSGERIMANSYSGFLVTLETNTGRVVDQVFTK
jgi:hypothetical protein